MAWAGGPGVELLERRTLLATLQVVDSVLGGISIGVNGDAQSAKVDRATGYASVSVGDMSQAKGTYLSIGSFGLAQGADLPVQGTADSANLTLYANTYWSNNVYEVRDGLTYWTDLPFSAFIGTGSGADGAPLTFKVVPTGDEQPGDKVVIAFESGDFPDAAVSYTGTYATDSTSGSLLASRNIDVNTSVGGTFQVGIALSASQTLGADFHSNVFDVGVVIALRPDLAPTFLGPIAGAEKDGLSFNYQVSISPVVDDTNAAFYWATGTTYNDRITSVPPLLYQIDQDSQKTLGIHAGLIPAGEFAGFLEAKPMNATHLLMVVDPDQKVVESDESNDVKSLALTDIDVTSLDWHPDTASVWASNPSLAGGVDFVYSIRDTDLPEAAPIALYWANGPTFADRIGTPITVGDDGTTLMTGTAQRDYLVHVSASRLGLPPLGVTNLLVIADPMDDLHQNGQVTETDETNNVKTLGVSADQVLANSVHASPSGSRITAVFMPESGTSTPASGEPQGALTIAQAAVICDVIDFNWVQTIALPAGWTAYLIRLGPTNGYKLSGDNAESQIDDRSKPGKIFLFLDPLQAPLPASMMDPSNILDPLQQTGLYPSDKTLNFLYTFNVSGVGAPTGLPSTGTTGTFVPPDNFEYYYNLNNDNEKQQTSYSLGFSDEPSLGLGRYSGDESTTYTTMLAGVKESMSPNIWYSNGTNFKWNSNAEHVGDTVSYFRVTSPDFTPVTVSGSVFGVRFVDPPVNHPPRLAATSDHTVDRGDVLTASALATDPDLGQTLSYSLDPGAPPGATIDQQTGVFSWPVPTTEPTGNYPVTIRVTDNGNPPLSNTTLFTIAVATAPQATSLSAVSGRGTYNGSASLTATLASNGSPLAGRTISFTLDQGGTITPIGMVTTNPNGVAILSGVSLTGFNAGTFIAVVGASFAGDSTDSGVSASGDLDVDRSQATLNLGGLVITYDGTPHMATASTVPEGLSGVSLTYAENNVAVPGPTKAGTYSVTATLNNRNYNATDLIGTLVINRGTPTITWANPTEINFGTGLGPAQLDATASVPGIFTYTPAAGTVLGVGQRQVLFVTFTPIDTTDYQSLTSTTVINVSDVAIARPPHAVGIAVAGHSKNRLTSISVAFDEALDPGSAKNPAFYSVHGAVKKHKKTAYSKGLGIRGVTYDENAHKVTITLAKPYKGKAQVTVHGGVSAANGATSSGDYSAIIN